jgi:hypothetical protein
MLAIFIHTGDDLGFAKRYNNCMKIQRIYIDTSVIGGCHDPEFAEWSNGLMQDFRDNHFKPLLSQVTAAEINNAPKIVQVVYAELVALGAEIIAVGESALELADEYQRRSILTPNYYDDGLHIAIATVAEADVLVSWNFRHIVRFDKIRLFNAVNLEYGYKMLQIFSPREVTTYGRADG